MVDGFDEISPQFKQTVIDMLQVLKQTTSLEQLWVTTRPHLREELEDNLQQLSYTLQPFSEVEQVEFLKKFWLETLTLEDMNQDRLQIYATALIRKCAQSISDKDNSPPASHYKPACLLRLLNRNLDHFICQRNQSLSSSTS